MNIMEIIEVVARHYKTSVSGILSSIRDDKIIKARHVAISLASSCTTASLPEIAKAFNRTHATAYFAERKVFERMAEDDVFRSEVEQLQRQLESPDRLKTAGATLETCDARWRRIQAFIQEAGIVLDYLHWRVLCKCSGAQPASALFLMTADGDGELTEEMVVAQLEAIARQARAGFVDGPGFPVFASLNRNTEEGK